MTKVPPQGVPRKTSITQGHGLWSLRVSIRGERIVRAIHAEADLSPRLSGCNGNVRDTHRDRTRFYGPCRVLERHPTRGTRFSDIDFGHAGGDGKE